MNRNYFEHVDDYLLGRLSGQELADFERALQEQPELVTQMKSQQQLLSVVETLGDWQMKERVRKIQQEQLLKPKAKVFQLIGVEVLNNECSKFLLVYVISIHLRLWPLFHL